MLLEDDVELAVGAAVLDSSLLPRFRLRPSSNSIGFIAVAFLLILDERKKIARDGNGGVSYC